MTRTSLVCDQILFVIRMTNGRYRPRVPPSFHCALRRNLESSNVTREAIDRFA
jgi:hypothetical protein